MGKHIEAIKRHTGGNAVLVFRKNDLPSYARSKLINARIPFVVPGWQMFIPFLFTDLKEFGAGSLMKKSLYDEKLSSSAQMLVLRHLSIESLEGLTLTELAKRFELGKMTFQSSCPLCHRLPPTGRR